MKNTNTPLQISTHGWPLTKARITIRHPLGLLLDFNANHPNAVALVAFGQRCIEDLENEHTTDHWSI